MSDIASMITKSKIAVLVLSFISFLSAALLTWEKIELLKDPNHVPSCSLNPFISCGPVMESWQASLFLIPNSVVGMVGFALAGLVVFMSFFVKLPKAVIIPNFIGITLATVFIGWLISQALFDIRALCIYCMIVWTMMIPMFWLTFSFTIKELKWTKLNVVVEYLPAFISVSYVAVALLVFVQFSDYWLSLLP